MPPKPKIKIPVHVFVYTIAFLPGSFYAYHWYKNAPTEEEFERKLRENYSQNIDNNRDKHAQMNAFLQSMKDPNSDQQRKMNDVLMGGRGEQKRLYSVDETLYGTEEGARLALEAQEKSKKKAESRTKKRKNKKREGDASSDGGIVDNGNGQAGGGIVKGSVVAMAVVAGTVAACASFLLGGRRSQ